MKPEAESGFWDMTERYEGKVPCLYLDVYGLVTTAIGNLCDDPHVAMSMPFTMHDGSTASPDDIRAEHSRVKAAFCGMRGSGVACPWKADGKMCLAHLGWRAAMNMTQLRLSDAAIRYVVMQKVTANERQLVAHYPSFDVWPWQAQLATHSMAWACGPGFHVHFPRLEEALQAGNWANASVECHINERGNAGIIPRNERNKQLYLESSQALAIETYDCATNVA